MVIRLALVGGSSAFRKARRQALESESAISVVYDSDGFGLQPTDVLDINFDVLLLEQRLEQTNAFDFLRAIHGLANSTSVTFGRVLITSQFSENELRLQAIEAGAVDCIFVSDGLANLVGKVLACAEPESDFGVRELLHEKINLNVNQDQAQAAIAALSTLNEKERRVLNAYRDLQTDIEISASVLVSKVRVRETLAKARNLLLLDTRSQLLLKLHSLGDLAL